MSAWRPSLRMAWRDVRRSRGRSILVLVMIALPVLGVTAADVIIQTSDVSGAEALDRRLGAADARLDLMSDGGSVNQAFDPDDGSSWSGNPRGNDDATVLADVATALGRDVRGIERREGSVGFTTDRGRGDAEVVEVDLEDPLAAGLFELSSGRWPTGPDEVVVNQELADRGPDVGEDLELVDGTTRAIVGIAESTSYRSPERAVGLPGAFGLSERRSIIPSWLVEAGPISWAEVRELNKLGFLVLSRSVMTDPPPESEIPAEVRSWSAGTDEAVVAIAALIAVMALIEVVLLAGPAFAVGARRQSRTLALMASAGGTPRQTRRVVLAGGLVLGALGAVLGAVLGLGVAWALLPVVQHFSTSVLGPFDVPWPHIAGVAAFGLLSAFLAAVVPAWIASRQDVVAVLAGRRGDRPPSRRSPLLGLLLLGIGVAGAVMGARASTNGEYYIAASAIFAVLGMVLLVPLVVVAVAGLARRLPFSLRYAARDAARHRTRTVPAVAAVAATVAGVVALGVANASDAAETRETYVASLPMGQGAVTSYARHNNWDKLEQAVADALPDARISAVQGVLDPSGALQVDFRIGREAMPYTLVESLGSTVFVSDGEIPVPVDAADDADLAAAEHQLAAGGVVVFTAAPVAGDEVRVVANDYSGVRAERVGAATVPATFVELGGGTAFVEAVMSPEAAAALDLEPRTVALLVDGTTIGRDAQKDVSEAVSAISRQASFDVERGYQPDDETTILLLVLGALGGVLMLGGTLTATFLALSDARPDLATLSAVGASPRSRRRVAAGYALVIGMVGAVLGAAVGFIPGIAITYPLTGESWNPDGAGQSHYLDVPWLLIGTLVVVLPLLTALIVGLTARSRLPLVARLD